MIGTSKILEKGRIRYNEISIVHLWPVYVEGRGRNIAAKRFMVRTTAMAAFTLFLGDFKLNSTWNRVDLVEDIGSSWRSCDASVRLGDFITVCTGAVSITSRDS